MLVNTLVQREPITREGAEALDADHVRAGPELSVVVPTFNEVSNVGLLVDRLALVLSGIRWEVIFVDDNSPDGTAQAVREMAQEDHRVRIVHRIGRRGLSSAVLEGFEASSAPFLAVIDGDLQHDETLLVEMLQRLRAGHCDLVVGSRYIADGSVGAWDRQRHLASRFATRLSKLVLRADLADPMSGFFAITRTAYERTRTNLSAQGYKILLDLVASAPEPLEIVELPYTFRTRQHGESKLDAMVSFEYLLLLADKLLGGVVPVRFLLFSVIGALGVGVHMAALAVLMQAAGAGFLVAQSVATFAAMTFNFVLNNWLTYRDRRLRGARALLIGWLSFCAVCSVGAVANVGIANFLFTQDFTWWISGLAGILVGAVWNYAASAFFTWRAR